MDDLGDVPDDGTALYAAGCEHGREGVPVAHVEAGLAHRGPYAMRHTSRQLGNRGGPPHVQDRPTMRTCLEPAVEDVRSPLPGSADRARVAPDAFLAADQVKERKAE